MTPTSKGTPRRSRAWSVTTHWFFVLCCAGATLLGGCASDPFLAQTIKMRMETKPEDYRRVEILPIWLAGHARTDASLTTNDINMISRQVGTNLLTALRMALVDKGYE